MCPAFIADEVDLQYAIRKLIAVVSPGLLLFAALGGDIFDQPYDRAAPAPSVCPEIRQKRGKLVRQRFSVLFGR